MGSAAERVLDALRQVKYPGFSRDIVSFGIVRDVEVGGFATTITLAPPADAPDLVERLRPDIERAVGQIPGSENVVLAVAAPAAPARPGADRPRGPQPIPGVANVIAVASGKGGVGKSTVAVNLALALRRYGRVGLLDADVYGPSAPVMLGIEGAEPHVTPERRITPIEAHGIAVISMGFFVEAERPIIWRGPMVTKLVQEFLRNVEWGELEFLVLDLPPGTGDVQLTLAQQLALTGGVIVTTPQEVALADVQRGLRMFSQMKVPVLGVIENMSGHECGSCGHVAEIFGRGGGERMALSVGVPFLGSLPLVRELRERSDRGMPLVEADPDHPVAARFREIADTISRSCRQAERSLSA